MVNNHNNFYILKVRKYYGGENGIFTSKFGKFTVTDFTNSRFTVYYSIFTSKFLFTYCFDPCPEHRIISSSKRHF